MAPRTQRQVQQSRSEPAPAPSVANPEPTTSILSGINDNGKAALFSIVSSALQSLINPEEFKIMKMQHEALLQNQQTIMDELKTLKTDIDEIKANMSFFTLAAPQPQPSTMANSVCQQVVTSTSDEDLIATKRMENSIMNWIGHAFSNEGTDWNFNESVVRQSNKDTISNVISYVKITSAV